MEQSKPSVFLGLLVLLACAGSGHGMRLLHDGDSDAEGYVREFAFGSMAAAETAPQDASLDDYEDEISRVEFKPGRGASYAATVAAAGPAPGPATAGSDAAPVATARPGTDSMKWWLPPSTMPSFPLFPNPGGMPGMPIPAMPVPLPALPGMPMPGGGMPMPGGIPGGGMPMPMPMPMPGGIPGGGMPFNFKPNGWGGGGGAGAVPSPPSQAQPTPPAASTSDGANDTSSDNPNPSEVIN